jgi:hypothetical protein
MVSFVFLPRPDSRWLRDILDAMMAWQIAIAYLDLNHKPI